jgi:hypothetical protein
MVINPISKEAGAPQPKPKRPKIRFFGPSDLEMNISGPLALQGGPRPDSRQGLIDVGAEKNRFDFDPGYFERPERPLSPGSMKSIGPVDPSKWPLPPDPVQTFPKPPESGLHKRNKSSYSLFPTRAEDVPRLPATVYTPPKSAKDNRVSRLALRRQTRRSSLGDTRSVTDITDAFSFLSKPAPLFANRHNRNQSTDSSATVQIGLRFSVAPATLAAAKCTVAERRVDPEHPPLRRDASDSSIETLGLPIQSPSTNSSTRTPFEEDTTLVNTFPEPPQRTASPGKTPVLPIAAQNSGAYLEQQREKVLPPTPFLSMPSPSPAAKLPPPRPAPPLMGPMSALRMNPVSPASPHTIASPASTPRSFTSNTTRSPTAPSPTARIPLGAGTMARSPPPNGWI